MKDSSRFATVSAPWSKTRGWRWKRLTAKLADPMSSPLSRPSDRLPRETTEGHRLLYELADLGAHDVRATRRAIDDPSHASSAPLDITADIRRRQHGKDRPFLRRERMFDVFVGKNSARKRDWNWVGSDLSGGIRIDPGGMGDLSVSCADFVDRIARKHDLQFWLSANFEPGCEVIIALRGNALQLTVEPAAVVNLRLILELFGFILPRQQRLLEHLQPADRTSGDGKDQAARAS